MVGCWILSIALSRKIKDGQTNGWTDKIREEVTRKNLISLGFDKWIRSSIIKTDGEEFSF